MELLHKVEDAMGEWYKKLSLHLPEKARKWLGDNVWWIVVVGLIASIFLVFSSLQVLFWAESIVRQTNELAVALGVTSPASGVYHVAVWISLITFVITIIIEAMSIKPLRLKKRSGWDLLFLAMIVGFVGNLLSGLFNGSIIASIIGVVVGLAIGGFFMFEIRSQFTPITAKAVKHDDEAAAKKVSEKK